VLAPAALDFREFRSATSGRPLEWKLRWALGSPAHNTSRTPTGRAAVDYARPAWRRQKELPTMTRRNAVISILLAGLVSAAVADRSGRRGADRPLEEPVSLPKYMTAEEKLLPLPAPVRDGRPPSGDIHCAAEYEPCEGIFFAWEGYTSLLTEMTVTITNEDPIATVYMVVDSTSEQNTARSTLQGAGADIDRVEFIIRATDTVWIRDYGPRFIFEDGIRAIVDHNYNRPRPNDNALNDYVATLWGEPAYDIPLTHGGGNFHLFANGDAFMSELILSENPGLTEQQVIDYYAQYQGVNLTITDALPTYVDSTQHIDMWMLPVADNKIIIGEYTFDPPQQITDQVAADLTSAGYTVYRTPGWTSGGTHYTYTNAIILNDIVFVPKFNVSQDAQALAVFQQALPDKTCYQVDCSSIIHSAGAVHCICMHVPAYDLGPEPLVSISSPDGDEFWTVGQQYDITWNALDDGTITGIDILLSTDGGFTFPITVATGEADDGVYEWTVPNVNSEYCRIKVLAHDDEGYTGEDVSAANFTITPFGPEQVYLFNMDTDPLWTTEGSWAYGQPTGGGGQYGDPDPTSGYTGPNVYGYNLNGDYEADMIERHLTSGALDCADVAATTVSFWRWLGVETPTYDHAYFRVSNDGVNWTTIWQNAETISDGAWVYQEYDISAVADGSDTVYLRWTMGTTDYAWQYCGWNLDDIEIWGIVSDPYVQADMNCDGVVSAADIDPFVIALTGGQAAYEAQFPDCNFLNADCNDDGSVSAADIDPFVQILTGN
jgi:agmatine deiminase